MCFGGGGAPAPPPPPPPPPEQPQAPIAIDAAKDTTRRRAINAAGMGSTLLTGAGGLTAPALTATKTLLGS